MNKVSDENLKQDILPLFVDRTFIKNWLKNWRESYLRFLDEYKINNVTVLERIKVHQDFHTDNFSFVYLYRTEEGKIARIIYTISDYWINFCDGNLPTKTNDKIIQFVESDMKNQLSDKLKQYVTLFYKKTEAYFKKTNRIMLGNNMATKVIRMTANNLDQKEQIILNKSALLFCELDDLLK